MIVIKKLIHCKYIKNITIKTLYNTKRFYINIYNFKMIFPINKKIALPTFERFSQNRLQYGFG